MKSFLLWHPDSPGMKVPVVRTWWQQLLYNAEFATLSEAIKWNRYCEVLK